MTQFDTAKHSNTKSVSLVKPEKNTKRKRSRAYTFTFNNYNQIDIDTLVRIFNSKKLLYVFQEETGLNGTKHLQGVIKFPNAVSYAFQNEFNKSIHWERCRSWPKSILYCSKLDTRTGAVFTNVQNLNIRKKPIDYFSIEQAKPWQLSVLELIDTVPDQRTINWYWENVGGVGKSVLTRHILLTRPGSLAVMGGCRDILCGVNTFIKEKELKILIIDVPRSTYENISYKAIEQIKNGFFYNTKYEPEMAIFDSPHIIVFSNFAPNEERLSSDRWSITEIVDDVV